MSQEHRLRAKEAFEYLAAHLREQHLLPDKHFLFNSFGCWPDGLLPPFCKAKCDVELDGANGVNLTINMEYADDTGELKFEHFAFGKSLDGSADGFYRMCRIAAECNLVLNGGGEEFTRKSVELTLARPDAETLLENCAADIDELELTEQYVAALKNVCAQLRTALGSGVGQQIDMPKLT